jgi:hypothetical protein
MKSALWTLAGAAILILFVVAEIVGLSNQRSIEADAEAIVKKAWAACESQFNPQRQSKQFGNCVDQISRAYIEGYKAGKR